jgi:hypothetical protein
MVMEFDDVKYDRQLIQLLTLLKEVDLNQFTDDLLVNDKTTFQKLKELMVSKGRVEFYSHMSK